eukprot:1632385-Prymnesium_polylepis.1
MIENKCAIALAHHTTRKHAGHVQLYAPLQCTAAQLPVAHQELRPGRLGCHRVPARPPGCGRRLRDDSEHRRAHQPARPADGR